MLGWVFLFIFCWWVCWALCGRWIGECCYTVGRVSEGKGVIVENRCTE